MPNSRPADSAATPVGRVLTVLPTRLRRRVALQAVDLAACAAALAGALVLRYDFRPHDADWSGFGPAFAVFFLAQLACGLITGLYTWRYQYGSLDEVLALLGSTTGATVVLAVLNRFVADRWVPVGVSILTGVLALAAMAAVRFVWRLVQERARRPGPDATRTVVVGADPASIQLVKAMVGDPASPYRPVALLDDDPRLANLRVSGVSVKGRIDQLGDVVAATGARSVVVAGPAHDLDTMRRIAATCDALGVECRVVPALLDVLGGKVALADVVPVSEVDLLGRDHHGDSLLLEVADYIQGRRVLVTGAGGSIGSELCRQLRLLEPEALIMVDRDESGLHATQLSLDGSSQLDDPGLVVADIRDRRRVDEIFDDWKPEVVFHTAALKHVPLLERFPDEAVKTNVLGTINVLDAARSHEVSRFVNLSTDKAADPTSVLGITKRLAERLTSSIGADADGTYVSVRFGNVLGSRGSVITAFRSQIAGGGPVTVTHPDVTRYFMTIEEAVRLVIQAGAIGRDHEVLVLDMGEPVRILELARQIIAVTDPTVSIRFTGLRDGEKMHEVLFGAGEDDVRPRHRLISHVTVPALTDADLDVLRSGPPWVDVLRLGGDLP